MSESKLILKVELEDNKPKVTLGTRHPALLSLALQLVDIQVKNTILVIDDIATEKSAIVQPEIKISESILNNL